MGSGGSVLKPCKIARVLGKPAHEDWRCTTEHRISSFIFWGRRLVRIMLKPCKLEVHYYSGEGASCQLTVRVLRWRASAGLGLSSELPRCAGFERALHCLSVQNRGGRRCESIFSLGKKRYDRDAGTLTLSAPGTAAPIGGGSYP